MHKLNLHVSEYISEVEAAQLAAQQEEAARQFLSHGSVEAQGIVSVLEKLHSPDQLPMYYSGGLRILTQSLTKSKFSVCRHQLFNSA